MIKFNYFKLSDELQEKYTEDEIFYLIDDIITCLLVHNKNYTKKQYNMLLDLQDIFLSFDIL